MARPPGPRAARPEHKLHDWAARSARRIERIVRCYRLERSTTRLHSFGGRRSVVNASMMQFLHCHFVNGVLLFSGTRLHLHVDVRLDAYRRTKAPRQKTSSAIKAAKMIVGSRWIASRPKKIVRPSSFQDIQPLGRNGRFERGIVKLLQTIAAEQRSDQLGLIACWSRPLLPRAGRLSSSSTSGEHATRPPAKNCS